MPYININDDPAKKIGAENTIKIILGKIDSEVQENNYCPQDFMIISPIVKNNLFLKMLEIEI